MKKLFTTLVLTALCLQAHAWEPQQPIQFIVPMPVGGSSDVVARTIVDGFKSQGIDNIVVINKPGAGGAIGTNMLVDSKPDGHTIMFTGTAFMFNRLQQAPGAEYDVVKSFSHVGMIGHVGQNVYARAGITENMATVIDNLRQGRKQYTWGTTNPGAEFVLKIMSKQLNQKLTVVPYKGSPQALTDLVGGHVDFIIDTPASPVLQAAVESGRIRLASSLEPRTESRNSVDQHLPGAVLYSWFGISLPKGADHEIVKFWNTALNRVLRDPAIQNRLQRSQLTLQPGTPEKFTNLIDSDFKKFLPVVDKIQ
jgi:tripartite-type tricarboxylate transporter receptor subunit TctC